MRHWIEINAYRGASDNGFSNTWVVSECKSRQVQQQLLNEGLPVNDEWYEDSDGKRHRSVSAMGIRIASPAGIRQAKADERDHGVEIPLYIMRDGSVVQTYNGIS